MGKRKTLRQTTQSGLLRINDFDSLILPCFANLVKTKIQAQGARSLFHSVLVTPPPAIHETHSELLTWQKLKEV